MSFRAAVVFALFACVSAQSAIEFLAAGEAGGSAGLATGAAIGAEASGEGIVQVAPGFASVSSVATASDGYYYPTVPKPDPKPTPKPTVYYPYTKYYVDPYPKCSYEYIYDDKCYDIKEYKKCGFCIVEKYPLKGYACEYEEEYVLKKDADKKTTYEVVYTPLCECEGEYIMDYEVCPSCDTMLIELLICAGYDPADPPTEAEIPAGCLEEVAADEDYVSKCGYFDYPKDYAKKGKPIKIAYPYKEDYKYPVAQAIASASASAGTLFSTPVATADATASVFGSGVAAAEAAAVTDGAAALAAAQAAAGFP
eukprot:TRINITY_DN4227_c0_g1_i3.p3 TRINITY_DN4227_c0_g1~~TRINITY_DN4227_c0_g1_i3.p3  ORF type:complete len:310 (-),score=70.47 TRINITY_DN4227_c0_g1_i3:404-1333(-)